jgi:3-isopropylmalate/(R)-2-methylmalate dehydratase large subunit
MKRRGFIKTSVGAAGLALSTPHSLLGRFETQEPRALYDKIWDEHVVANLGGSADLLHFDRMITRDSGPALVHRLLEEGLTIPSPELILATPDHSVSTSPDRYTNRMLNGQESLSAYEKYTEECEELGILVFGMDDPRHGISHAVGPDTGLTQPGLLVLCGDSHSCTHGGMGAISWGVNGERKLLLTGTVIKERPRPMRVTVEGTLGPMVGAKDVILYIIGQLGADSGNGSAVEYAGPVVRSFNLEQRLTICNMAIEMASDTAIVAPDDATYEYLAGREFAPRGRYWDQALSYWRTLTTDPGAVFDRDETIDMTGVEPQVTWGISPEHVIGIRDRVPDPEDAPPEDRDTHRQAIEYTGLTPGQPILGTPIDEAFIGSCGENRLGDLRAAAEVIRGRRVAPNVVAWVIPGSRGIKSDAEAEGIDQIFTQAGFEWREPGCSKCLASNGDYVPPGDRCISNSNRNFMGRQGRDAITHIASTSMVAAAAIAGHIVDVREL